MYLITSWQTTKSQRMVDTNDEWIDSYQGVKGDISLNGEGLVDFLYGAKLPNSWLNITGADRMI